MAFRALLFSKSPETGSALTAACDAAGIHIEVCSDIFEAIEKGTKQPFSCVLADWSAQPETGFLLKRTRESTYNPDIVAVAIVDHDPTTTELRENRLDFLIYRPIFPGEAQQVLAKASEKMPPVSAESIPAASAPSRQAAAENAAGPQEFFQDQQVFAADQPSDGSGEEVASEEEPHKPEDTGLHFPFSLRQVCATVLSLAALYCLWNARATVFYLAQTREGRIRVLKESVAALFYLTPSGATPATPAMSEAQQDAYFSRGPAAPPDAQAEKIGVVSTQAEVNESQVHVKKSADFPLPAPEYQPPAPQPVHTEHAAIPESLRHSAPIAQPTVVTVNPSQMMPVSMPAPPPLPQQVSEPVSVSEETARSMLLSSVNPTYPPEAAPQKLHGPIVLQATIARDGTVEDLKIVRGPFILCKAAIAAVKQWRFQPYTLNGRTLQTQTMITINFPAPQG